MKKNVLVFPCGSEIGLEIYKSVNLSTHFTLYGGSSVPDHGQFVYENYIDGIPFAEDSNFINRINEIVERYKIDFIFPAHDSVVLKLAQEYEKGTLGCKVVTSSAKTCEISRSKKMTYEALDGVIAIPRVYANASEVSESDLPLFLKPDVGQGSKGTYKAKTIKDINFYLNSDPSLLLLEYLPGKEYTIDCFTGGDGKLLFCEGRERKRVSGGISVSSATVKDDRFLEIAKKINETISFKGVWFFQVKENKNQEPVLMEIAPRIAGTMGLVRCKGVNLSLLSLFDALDYEVDIFENHYEMVIDRALQNKYRHDVVYRSVYLDFDDTVILDGKINLQVMSFVMQCVNNGVKVYLLTRHAGVIDETLRKYRLAELFDEVISIKNGDNKSLYIREKDAIFIDDSFAERKEVFAALNIPVFDTHMLESLIR